MVEYRSIDHTIRKLLSYHFLATLVNVSKWEYFPLAFKGFFFLIRDNTEKVMT